MKRRSRLLPLLNLSLFNPETEQVFEEWVSLAAEQVSRHKISCNLFQEAWIAVASPGSWRRFISLAAATENYEDLVDSVARRVFNNTHFVMFVETRLSTPLRQLKVFESRFWVEENISLYYRLCKQHNYPFELSDTRLVHIALSSLPREQESDIRSHLGENPSFESLWVQACDIA